MYQPEPRALGTGEVGTEDGPQMSRSFGQEVEALVGHATVGGLSRHMCLATFSSVYKFIEASCTEKTQVYPAQAELRVISGLMSLTARD